MMDTGKGLNVPTGFSVITKGTTGMWYNQIEHYTKYGNNGIIPNLKGINYGTYQTNFWDCDSKAYYGIANARCKMPGVAIGLAAGKALYEEMKGKGNHSIIIAWAKNGGGEYTHFYYDPADNVHREIRPDEFVPDFIVPFPTYWPIGYPNERKDIPPFNNWALAGTSKNPGYIMLNPNYGVGQSQGILNYLANLPKCPNSEADLFSREDEAFWAYMQARHEIDCPNGQPANRSVPSAIGFALGEANSEDQAAVVVWTAKNDAIFWSAKNRAAFPSFKPRLIIA